MAIERRKTLTKKIVSQASVDAFNKLNTMVMIKNPVIFIVLFVPRALWTEFSLFTSFLIAYNYHIIVDILIYK